MEDGDEDELLALASQVQVACLARGLTVSVAESCTGGLLGHLLTNVSGASAYFAGGAVTYGDGLKRQILGVPAETLTAHGAVSAQVAVAMATGGRQAFATDLCAAVTGIAGPEGGSRAKPVGLTYVAVAGPSGTEVKRFIWPGDRRANKTSSADAALRLLLAAATGPS